jgi:hypothetical protein
MIATAIVCFGLASLLPFCAFFHRCAKQIEDSATQARSQTIHLPIQRKYLLTSYTTGGKTIKLNPILPDKIYYRCITEDEVVAKKEFNIALRANQQRIHLPWEYSWWYQNDFHLYPANEWELEANRRLNAELDRKLYGATALYAVSHEYTIYGVLFIILLMTIFYLALACPTLIGGHDFPIFYFVVNALCLLCVSYHIYHRRFKRAALIAGTETQMKKAEFTPSTRQLSQIKDTTVAL